MVKTVTTREFRAHMAGVFDDVMKRFDRYVISKRGKPAAILMCVDDYEGWIETLEILSSKKALKDIESAKREMHLGKGYSFEEVFVKPYRATRKRPA